MISQFLFFLVGIIFAIFFILVGLLMIAYAICEHGGLLPLVFGIGIITMIIAIVLHLLGM